MAAKFLGVEEMRADELGHNVAACRHLEDTTLVTFVDQAITTRQPLRTNHMRSEERGHIVPRAIATLDIPNAKPTFLLPEIARLNSFGKLSRLERLEEFVEVSGEAESFFRKGSARQWQDHTM